MPRGLFRTFTSIRRPLWLESWSRGRTWRRPLPGAFISTPTCSAPASTTCSRSTKVQAVATFTSIFDHERVVEVCADTGMDVMVEKPLAVNMDHARAIAAAVKAASSLS